MSFKAQLNLGSKKFDVLHCSYAFRRDVDGKGRPASIVYGGTIDFEVESTEDTTILETMINNIYKPINGSVVFKKTDEDANMKELKFTDAYFTNYQEALDTIGTNPMTIRFTVSARKLDVGNATHANDWPDKK